MFTNLIFGQLAFATKYFNITQDSNYKCAEEICFPADYSKQVAPILENGNMEVLINFEIWQILEFDDVRFTISLLMYLGVTWNEPRIIASTPDDPDMLIPIDIGFVKSMWLPDIYIYDMKEIKIPKFNIPFAGECNFCLFLNMKNTDRRVPYFS